ncbi:hypothetical protein ACP4J4_02685 [Aureimonas ureilytica]|uniref:hypothetical protein n=1 Tax=Aureimonas ureilytica TaxID=401562 RepID=UPI003CE96183
MSEFQENDMNSHFVRTASHWLQLGPDEAQIEMVIQCLDELRCRLEVEEEEEDDFLVITEAQQGECRPATITAEEDAFIVGFDYGGDGNCSRWATHFDARKEVARLLTLGWATQAVDYVAETAESASREIKILTMSEPDEVGTRAFTVEYQGSPFDAALLEDGSVRTIGIDLPKEILELAHQKVTQASDVDRSAAY